MTPPNRIVDQKERAALSGSPFFFLAYSDRYLPARSSSICATANKAIGTE